MAKLEIIEVGNYGNYVTDLATKKPSNKLYFLMSGANKKPTVSPKLQFLVFFYGYIETTRKNYG